MALDSAADRVANRADVPSHIANVNVTDLYSSSPATRDTGKAALNSLPPLDIVHGGAGNGGSGGACRPNDPCLKFRPEPNSNSANAREWRRQFGEQKGKSVDTDEKGDYRVQPGDCIEGIAQRMARQRGDQSPAAVRKAQQELLEANKADHPKLDCNPHYLRPGMTLHIPGDKAHPQAPAQGKGDHSAPARPGDNAGKAPEKGGDAGKAPEHGDNAGKTPEKGGDAGKAPEKGDAGKTPEKGGDAGKTPADKAPESKSKPGDDSEQTPQSCHDARTLKLLEAARKLTPDEQFGALNIYNALRSGNEKAVQEEIGHYGANPEALKHIAQTLNQVLKDDGVHVSADSITDLRTAKTTPFISLYREGAQHDINISASGDEVGSATMRDGAIISSGPALIGREHAAKVMEDIRNALAKQVCRPADGAVLLRQAS